jgi:cell division septation protein DedD
VQVGSFSDAGNAQALAQQLRNQGVAAYVAGGHAADSAGSASGYMVRSVAVRSNSSARRLARQYRLAGYRAHIVPAGNGKVAVAVGTYASKGHADALVSALNRQGLYGAVHYAEGAPAQPVASGGLARVYVGRYGSKQAAAAKMRQLQSQGIPAAVTSY